MVLTTDHYIQLKDGAFDGTTKGDLDNLFKTLAADPRRDSIVLHFHGELVGVTRAMQVAENLTLRYQGINTYQVFFIWETGVMEVMQQEGGYSPLSRRSLDRLGMKESFNNCSRVSSSLPGPRSTASMQVGCVRQVKAWPFLMKHPL